MNQRETWIARVIGRVSLVVAALLSLFIVRSLQPDSAQVALLASGWLLLPYVILALVLETASSAATRIATVITTLLVATGGLLFLLAVVYVNPDPQSGIAVLFTPVYQLIATAVLLPVTRWLFTRDARSPDQ